MIAPTPLRALRPGGSMLAALAMVLLLAGCSAEHYRRSADREAYAIIGNKADEVPGMSPSFRLEQVEGGEDVRELEEAVRKGRIRTLSLPNAIRVAAANNRPFLDQREDVYRRALDLTRERHVFSPQFFGILSGVFSRDTDGERTAEADAEVGLTQTLATGADVGLSLTSCFLRYLSGDPRETADSVLELSVTQPLWRGAGKRIAQENLVQAERDMIYELRDFVRFRRSFFVEVTASYFKVLQQKDVTENERLNLENLTAARRRAEMLGKAGRLPGFQVDQTVQDELQARDRWVQAVRRYENALEDFKIVLGFAPDLQLTLEEEELRRLRGGEVTPYPRSRHEAIGLALANRLDLAVAADRIADAERKVEVARDDLGPDLDLVLTGGIGTDPPAKPLKFSEDQTYYSAGLDLSLPLDRLIERNTYRRSLIDLDKERRDYELLHDRVVQQVNVAWRKLEEARRRVDIQRKSVELARQRVDSTSLLIEAGRAEMRDLLEAQEALVRARNSLSETLIDYHIARLEMWRDTGLLAFKDGQFTEAQFDDNTETESN